MFGDTCHDQTLRAQLECDGMTFSRHFLVDGEYDGPAFENSCYAGTKVQKIVWYDQDTKTSPDVYFQMFKAKVETFKKQFLVITGDKKIKHISDIVTSFYNPFQDFKTYLQNTIALLRKSPCLTKDIQMIKALDY